MPFSFLQKGQLVPRPTNKSDLIKAANDEFTKLCALLDSTPKDLLKSDFKNALPKNARDKNARDILIHLYEWSKMLENFITNNLEFKGKNALPKPKITPFLPSPYNFRTYPKLNIELWQKHQNTSFDEAYASLKQSHERVLKLINKLSEKALFTKAHFAFTLTSSLASYAISSTSSHYAWAIKQLKNGFNNWH